MRYRTPTGRTFLSHLLTAQACRHLATARGTGQYYKKEVLYWTTKYHFWRHQAIREIRRMERSLGILPRSSRDWVVTNSWIDPQH